MKDGKKGAHERSTAEMQYPQTPKRTAPVADALRSEADAYAVRRNR